MKNKFFIFILLLFWLTVLFNKKILAVTPYDCQNRNPDCSTAQYPTCKKACECNAPDCTVRTIQESGCVGPYKFYCAQAPLPTATSVPTATPTLQPNVTAPPPTLTPVPTGYTGCPECPSGYHWHITYSTCCQNGETPECHTTANASFSNCFSGQVCRYGTGCENVVPTPPNLCGYADFYGREACCFRADHSPQYYCFTGNPDKQGSGCTCKLASTVGSAEINFNSLSTAIPGLKDMFKAGSPAQVSSIISELMKYLFVIAGLLLLFYLIAGGFQMMMAANDEKGLVGAKGKITNALVGFLLLFVSYWIVQIIEYILGIKIF